jgi:feruloyl esterase
MPRLILLAGAMFALFPGQALAQARPPLADPACGALAKIVVPADKIALPTRGATILSASMAQGAGSSRQCIVLGMIHARSPGAPPILFRLNLPVEWNEKAVQLGGAGYNGRIAETAQTKYAAPGVPDPVQSGYAVFASDSGHQQAPGEDPAAFAANAEALANFAGDQLKKTHDAALFLIARAYGTAPRRVYFHGSSQGGHEAFTVVQRWPADYDGAVAIHPVYNFTALQTDGVLLGQAIYNRPGAWISPAKTQAIAERAYALCDGLDGLKDGVIANVTACTAQLKPETLRCPQGLDSGGDCLSDAQVALIRSFTAPMALKVALASGDHFSGWPVLTGARSQGFFITFGDRPDHPRPPKPGDSFPFFMGDQMVRHLATGDPAYDSLTFDPAVHADRLKALSAAIDTADPDISAFRQRGGKLLLMHGTVDMAVPPGNSVAYYDRLVERFGPDLKQFVRFYLAPGFGHGDGPFQVGWDSLGALDAWVERGTAPEAQIVTDTAKGSEGRTRPLCEYPAFPRYRGEGDVETAASFVCATR